MRSKRQALRDDVDLAPQPASAAQARGRGGWGLGRRLPGQIRPAAHVNARFSPTRLRRDPRSDRPKPTRTAHAVIRGGSSDRGAPRFVAGCQMENVCSVARNTMA
jgi:hypothetical protein